MGGEVLELVGERCYREGYAERYAEGYAEGVVACLDEFSKHLAELGVSPEVIKKAADATRAKLLGDNKPASA